MHGAEPGDDPKASVIWEAFKADTEPDRATRSDEFEAKRAALIAAIRSGGRKAAEARTAEKKVVTENRDFAEQQGGVY